MISQQDLDKRKHCERRRAALELQRSTFMAHWRELSEYILPRRSRFFPTDSNKGDKRHQKIIDSTATECADILSAGLMSGATNPAHEWFKLTVSDSDLAENPNVKAWLFTVQQRMEKVFVRSNIYNKFPILYKDSGVFGTGAMGVFEDDEQVIRAYDFPLGSFAIGLDAKCRVRLFTRAFQYSVQQVVEKWGHLDPETGLADFERGEETTLSLTVQLAWTKGTKEQAVDIVHLVQPNQSWDSRKIEAKYRRFEELYYESGKYDAGFLEHKGYDEWPILVARWETAGEDAWGTTCPGMSTLGDVKQLQYLEKKKAQAVEKKLNPPLKGPSELKNQRVSTIAGDITYTNERSGQAGLQPIYQVDFDIGDVREDQAEIRDRIKRAFKADLFLMLSDSDRRDQTAREVDEKHEEKLLALGPTYGQLTEDVLDPLIERTYAVMERQGLIPEPPTELHGVPLTIEYVSIIAQAMASVRLSGLDRFAGAIQQLAEDIPDVLDRFNADAWVGEYAEGSGVAPTVLRTVEEAQALRDQRNQQAAQQQNAENLKTTAGAARDLGAAPVTGNSALASLVSGMRAKQTVAAGQTPVAALPGSTA